MEYTKPQLIEKIKKLEYEPPGNLKKEELVQLYKNLKKCGETYYPEPEEVEYTPLNPKVFQVGENIKKAEKYLHKRGYIVYQISDFNASYYVQQFQEYVNKLWDPKSNTYSPFDFEDRETWKCKNLPLLLNGIFKNGASHMEWFWDIREQCIPIFSQIYGTDNLLCSFDGINLSYRKKENSHSWMHCDSARCSSHLTCYQGVVNLLPNSSKDGGLLVIHGSHKIYDNYLHNHPTAGYGWYRIQMGDPLVTELPIYKLNLEPGQIAIWNSKTFHCNMQPLSKNLRLAAYVSMMPRKGATKEELQKRIKTFEEGKGTNHFTYGPQFSTLPLVSRFGGYRLQEVEIPNLTSVQKRLVGYRK